jgi:hypothetical protein
MFAVLKATGWQPRSVRGFLTAVVRTTRPDARLREDRRRTCLPHRGEQCLAKAQRQTGSQGGVSAFAGYTYNIRHGSLISYLWSSRSAASGAAVRSAS